MKHLPALAFRAAQTARGIPDTTPPPPNAPRGCNACWRAFYET